jgi:hypothetical protein
MRKIICSIIVCIGFLSCRQNIQKNGFERIIFHTSGCFGSCPTYHLEIDSSKNVKLFTEFAYEGDPTQDAKEDKFKMGHFTGKLEDSLFYKLKNIIDTLKINSLKFEEDNCCDGSTKTIISYYDGKRNYLKSMRPPFKTYFLISTLTEICEKSKLQRTNSKFEIEK